MNLRRAFARIMYVFIWIYFVVASRYVDAGCTGMHCNGHGTISEEGNYCHCVCDESFSGLQCDFRLRRSKWPQGPYALPMQKGGCPEQTHRGWYTGYINMTFKTPFSQNEICHDQVIRNNISADGQLPSDMLGPYDDFNLQMNFCYKSSNHLFNKGKMLPETVYGATSGCPSGFHGNLSSIYLPPILQWNADGYLPYFDVISEDDHARLQFLYCGWRNDSEIFSPVGHYMYIKNENVGCNNQSELNAYPFPLYHDDCKEVQYCNRPDPVLNSLPRRCDESSCTHLTFDMGRTYIFKKKFIRLLVLSAIGNQSDLTASNDKWAFNYDDRQRCLLMNMFEWSYCDRAIQGRYITLQFQNKFERHVLEHVGDRDLYIEDVLSRYARYSKLSCFESLGMKDFHIKDYQLRASSSETGYTPNMARPQHAGWCAAREDTRPYIQVDVLIITAFDGIVIYNWEKVAVGNYTNNMYSLSGELQGAYSFFIMFGSSDSHLKLYNERNFQIDMSRPFAEPQTFQFAKQFLARFIRVYPRSHSITNHVCLKIELLGCKQFESHSLRCTVDSKKEIIETSTALVPVSNNYTEIKDFTKDDCKNICLRYQTTCIAVQYSSTFNICKITFSDNRQNFHEVSRDDMFDYLWTVNCIPGNVARKKVIMEEGLITSRGYPIEYWTEKHLPFPLGDRKDNLKLIFTDISFKRQKGKEDGVHLSRCKERLYIKDADDYMDKLTVSHNGMRLAIILPRDGPLVHQTCFGSTWEAEKQPSRGLRAHVLIEETPTCFMNNKTLLRTCQEPVMQLQTFTLMGYPSREHLTYTWSVIPSVQTDTIAFTFTEFYISCQTDSRVTIAFVFGGTVNYCNKNRPLGTTYFTTPLLYITMRTSLMLQYIVLEGFDAKYSTIKNTVTEYEVRDTFGSETYLCTFEDPDVCRYTTHAFATKVARTDSEKTDADGNPHGHFMHFPFHDRWDIYSWLGLPVQSARRYYRYWFFTEDFIASRVWHVSDWQVSECYETKLNGTYGYMDTMYPFLYVDNILLLDNCSDAVPDHVHEKVKHVCSSTFDKCYNFQFESETISWLEAAKTCASLGTSLVRIGSLAESTFLKNVFFGYWFTHRIWVDNETIPYVHIGLARYIDTQGEVHETWTDGRLLTYTSWEKYEPTNIYHNRCTRMKLQSYNSTGDWSSEPCDMKSPYKGAVNFICEQPYKKDTLPNDGNRPNRDTLNDATNEDVLIGNASFTFSALDGNTPNRDPLKDATNEDVLIGNASSTCCASDGNATNRDHLNDATNEDAPVENATLFHCSSGEDISILSVCNGIAECLSASDENNCTKEGNICGKNEFQCEDGDCVHISVVCDHIPDCKDSSDEFCSQEPCLVNEEFSCQNGQCIPMYQRCDATPHCLDKSDESNCVTCNDTKAFQCDTLICVPARMVCDNVVDCQDGSDETSCANLEYKTCDDVLKAGFKDSGAYSIVSGQYMFCDFGQVNAGIITMSYHNIDWKVLVSDKEYVTNSMTFFKYALNDDYNCSQDFTPSLKPLEAEIAELDNLTYPGYEIQAVFEIIPSISHEQGYNSFPVTKHTFLDVAIVNRREYNLRVFVHTSFDKERFRLPNNPVVCTKIMAEEQDEAFPCGHNLNPIPMALVCMYQLDEGGNQAGCRNLEHLQNCKDTMCNTGFVKCPDSYCIPQEYVCNGRIDCEHGHDELGCWCEDTEDIFVVAVSEGNVYEQEQAFDIASKYVNHMSDVFIVTVAATGLSSVKRLIYPSERVVSAIDKYTDSLDNSLQIKKSGTGKFVLISVNLQETSEDVAKHILSSAKVYNWQSELSIFRVLIDNEISTVTAVTVPRLQKITFTDNQTLFLRETEIRVKIRNHLITAGSLLFPGICTGQSRRNCDGGYVCMFSRVCIPKDKLCDNISNCPYGDDERLCDFICPSTCTCDGLSVHCSNTDFVWSQMNTISKETRMLDLSYNSKLKGFPITFSMTFPYLTDLNVSHSGVQELSIEFFKSAPNIRILDCRYNDISKISTDSFKELKHLIHIYLEGNRFLTTIEPGAFSGPNIQELSLRHCAVHTLEKRTFYGLDLAVLDLSANDIVKIEDLAFDGLSTVKLDITDNPIKDFGKDIFKGSLLTALKTPSYKFCCFRPDYLKDNDCEPREDEFSSCADLMRNSALQALLWIIGFFAVLGNVSSLVFRIVLDRERLKIGYGIFVTNLAIADLLMGIYLLIIAVADVVYRDRYILMDEYWRSSGWCKFCGVISTISSEGSILFICLITIDRILVIKYPFGQIRLRTKSAIALSGICWIVVSVASVIPIVYDEYFEGRFYSSRAVCTALPLTRDRPSGWLYSVVIFIGFNLVAFILIAFGQCSIYAEVRKASKRKKKMNVTRSNDLTIARNLLLVVTTDFMCWFPIGCMGVMAMAGYPIPNDMYAWTVVLILPINSAINPIMYTYSVWIGRRNMNPSVGEQSHTDVSKEAAQAVGSICPRLYDGLKKRSDLRSLEDILMVRKVTPTEAVYVARRLFEYIESLHQINLVVEDITGTHVFTQVNEIGNMTFGDVYLFEIPHEVRRPTDKAANVKTMGLFLHRLLN